MEEHAFGIKATVSAFFGFLTALWGWLGWLVVGWVACMTLDFISGSIVGGKNHEWSSTRARAGLLGKGGMILVVVCAAAADWLLGMMINHVTFVQLSFEYSTLVCPIVICWYIVAELGSILENAVALGAPCPGFLKGLLKMMSKAVDDAGEKIGGKNASTVIESPKELEEKEGDDESIH